jgi:hypothetical protein
VASEDLRYIDRNGNRVSWLSTAHAYWNGWLYPNELAQLRASNSEEAAERLVREAQQKIEQRLETWRIYQ